MTRLLKKNSFSQDEPTKQDFISFKNAMCLTPILIVTNFSNPFFLECDELGTSIGDILTQKGGTMLLLESSYVTTI